MMLAIVTRHAAERWSERVHECSIDEAIDEIRAHSPIILKAAQFGATCVKLPSNHRLVLKGRRVLTVLPYGRRASR
jgi:hypothetical protein